MKPFKQKLKNAHLRRSDEAIFTTYGTVNSQNMRHWAQENPEWVINCRRKYSHKIPIDHLPESLKDEKRINVLFAPLRSRRVNAKDWDSKMSSWKSIIKLYCDCNDVYSFTLSALNSIFIRNGRPPSCLTEVISEMLKTGEIQTTDDFLKRSLDTWSEWATNVLIKMPLSWSYNKIKNSIFTYSDKNIVYVHLEVIKSKCDSLLASVPNKNKNKLISLHDLLIILGKGTDQAENVKLLLHYLCIQRKIAATKLNKTFLIKFGDGSKVMQISDIDIGIYTLEKNEKLLAKNMELLEDEIQTCHKDAKLHLSKNHRQLSVLQGQSQELSKEKNMNWKKRLEKKGNALHNIQMLLEQIHETHSDVHVWEAYKNALSAFNTTFKDTGLSEEAIEDTMINLGDMLERHEDIQSALARPAMDLNESDLEEELAELLKDDANDQPPDDSGITSDLEKQMEKLSLNLPVVPSNSPNVTIEEDGNGFSAPCCTDGSGRCCGFVRLPARKG
ncbi:hypothetical protein NQ318_014674 [Aromia moschata]|uniref:Charged multivesicular body protein 7 n=1 Tax=Aromia moschata TaxID=1265417 RepID=A0AAV8ZB76_9CUCU|nr:hypothetical protein NQ318_014674 [Aromia moschata]